MTERKSILVPLDGSPEAEAALPYAVSLANMMGTSLRLLSVVQTQFEGPLTRRVERDEELHRRQREVMETYLSAKAAQLREQGLDALTEVRAGEPPEEILVAAGAQDISMIVMATHGRGGLGRWALGSVADKVMRLGQRPTLLVCPPNDAATPSTVVFRQIMVPLDGSPLAEAALGAAAELATASGASVILIRVEPWLATLMATEGYMPDLGQWQEDIEAAALKYLQAAQQRLPAGLRSETVVLRGPAAVMLEEYAQDRGVNLVAMTTRGHGGLTRLVLGSTADRLVRAGLPTLLVHPPSDEGLSEPEPQEVAGTGPIGV